MKKYHLAETETKFAELIWENEPIPSPQLVTLCDQKFNWKKSTTYTVLKKLCDKGIFQNQNAVVTSLISRETFYSEQSRQYVEETFQGSLPRFLTAFFNEKRLSPEETAALKKYIEEYGEESK